MSLRFSKVTLKGQLRWGENLGTVRRRSQLRLSMAMPTTDMIDK